MSILASSLGNKSVAVYINYVNGSGDISCALKCANLLHEKGGIPSNQIWLVTKNNPEIRPKIQSFNRHNFPIYEQLNDKIQNIALQIIIPIGRYSEAAPLAILNQVKTIALYEYDFRPDDQPPLASPLYESYILGLKPENLGVFINSVQETTISQSDLFQKLSKDFKEVLLKDSRSDAFFQHNKLYIGYGSFQLEFMTAVLENYRTSCRDQNFVFILPPGGLQMQLTLDNLKGLAKTFGFGKLIVYGQLYVPIEQLLLNTKKQGESEKNRPETIIINEQEKSVLTCFLLAVPNADFSILFKLSERPTLVTGDQSVIEAIEADKMFAVDEKSHKSGFGVSINSIFSSLQPSVGYLPSSSTVIGNVVNRMKNLFSTQAAPEYTRFNHLVCQTRDCSKPLLDIVSRLLLTSLTGSMAFVDQPIDFVLSFLAANLNTPLIISQSNMSSLKISYDTSQSSIPALTNMTFKIFPLGSDLYWLKRTS